MVPGWLLEKRVSPMGLAVYVHMASHGTWNPGTARYDECRPAIATLCAETGLSEGSVRKALRELLDHGALTVGGKRYDSRGGQLPMVYRVIFGEVVPPGGITRNTPPPQPDTPPGVPPNEPNQEPSTKNQHQELQDADAPSASKLLADWIDWLKAKGIETLPGQTKARYGKELKQALADGFSVKVIGKALQTLYQRGKASNPQLLPHILIEVQAIEPVSSPPRQQAKSFRQMDAEAADAETARMRVAQDLIDQGMQPRAAYNRAKAMETNAGVPYIEGECIDTTAREVTSE